MSDFAKKKHNAPAFEFKILHVTAIKLKIFGPSDFESQEFHLLCS